MQQVRAAAELPRVGQPLLQGPDRLVERRLEGPLDGHDFTGRFHLRPECPIAGRKLIEGPARNLDHAVVQGRLKRGSRLSGHRVGDLMQQAPGGNLGSHPGDWIAGRFGGQRG